MLPISVGGLGVREGLLAFFLHSLGVPTGQAVAVGLLWYAMTLLVSLLGAPAFAVGHRHPETAGDGPTGGPPVPASAAGSPGAGRDPRRRDGRRATRGRTRLHRRLPGARVLRDGTVLYWWVEIIAIAVFYFVYSQIRNANGNDPAAAFANASDIIHWQRLIGIYHEQTLQSWALHFRPIIVFCNYWYGSMHFIVTGGVMVFLYRKWSDDYPTWRNTLGIATAIALIGFTLYPLMPPRLLPAHYGFDPLTHYTTFWTINGGQEHLQPVRRDAERPLRMGAVVARARWYPA